MTKEIRDAGRIEVAHHWTLKWEDYHGLVDYLYRSSVILNVLVKDRTRDEDLKMLLVLKMEGRVMSQGMKVALKVGKGKKIDVPLQPLAGTR